MATRLRPVPDTPPRAVLYLRQSVARDDSISLDLQESAGRAYCLQKGYQVVGVESDPGISGRTFKRPAVTRVMTMIEAGNADVVVLWKWSRLSRSRRDWAIAVDRVDVAGGRIESATESIDVSTASGRLARGVLAEFAAFESDRIGEVWKEVQASRVADGKTPNGLPKWGYVWNREQQIHEPDPVAGPAMAEAYERYVAGVSFRTLAFELNARGIPTTKGNMWSATSLLRAMDVGFAAGFIPYLGELHPGRHEPLISEELWREYKDVREARHFVPPRSRSSRYLLTSMIKCGRCDGAMVGNKGNGRGDAYRCSVRKGRGPEACAAGSVQVAVVEGKVLEWLRTIADGVEAEATAAAESSVRQLSAEAEVARLTGELTRLDDAMTRLTVQVAEGLVPESAYGKAQAELGDRYVAVQTQLEVQARLARRVDVDRQQVASDLLGDWSELELSVKRELLKSLLTAVRVTTPEIARGEVRPRAKSFAVVDVMPSWSGEWVRV